MLLCESLNESHIVIALVVGALAKFALHTVNALFHACGAAESLARLLLHSGIIGQLQHIAELNLYFHLTAAADLGMMVFNINSPVAHCQAHA